MGVSGFNKSQHEKKLSLLVVLQVFTEAQPQNIFYMTKQGSDKSSIKAAFVECLKHLLLSLDYPT